MIHALPETSERCVSDLAATVGSSESSTSHRLRRIRLAELLPGDRRRTAHYRLADSRVWLLLETAIEHHLHDGETS